MKKLLIALLMLSPLAHADDEVTTNTITVKCNWGTLTMTSIQAGFPQGQHVSDPSGDGKGPGDLDSPRVGLGNVIEQGSLQSTCEFIASQIDG